MGSCFDQIIDRRKSDSIKWHKYGDDVLPLWVADMDFASSDAVIEALRKRVEHGVFGYGEEPEELRLAIVEKMEAEYHWSIPEEAVVFLPGVITGFNLACHAFTEPGDGLLVQTPVYPPILNAYRTSNLTQDEMELTRLSDGSYAIDFEAFKQTITDQTQMFLLCNPHNPVGRVFTQAELEKMAEICLRNDILICSDEIHSDLVFSESHHVPIASLDPQIARRTITLMAPSKTYNIAGLDCSFAIIPDAELHKQFLAARGGMVGEVNILGFTAALAAYQYGQDWLDELLVYLQANRDILSRFVDERLPGISMGKPEGTYLAWLDCRQAGIGEDPASFFLENARVALNDGHTFGTGGEGFVRLNFGCPRSVLETALEKMETALCNHS
ncbi:MAG: PatB family C-S lyase [Chloroflexi bacterium]|nr:PatB family C-S lyase [Chloroflexota bacterium]